MCAICSRLGLPRKKDVPPVPVGGGCAARSVRMYPCYSQRTFSGFAELDLYALLCVNSVHVYYA